MPETQKAESTERIPASTRDLLARLKDRDAKRQSERDPEQSEPAGVVEDEEEDTEAGDDDAPAADQAEESAADEGAEQQPEPEQEDKRTEKLREAERRLEERAAAVAREREAMQQYAPRLKHLEEAEAKVLDDPIAAVKSFLAAAFGDEAQAEEEFNRIYEERTRQLLGADVDQGKSGTSDTGKLRRDLEKFKREQAARRQEEEKQRAEREHQQAVESAVESIGAKLAEQSQQYPWLMAEEEPARVVFDIIEARHAKDGVILDLGEAAKLANNHFQKQWSAAIDRRKNLLAPETASDGTKPAASEATKQKRATGNRPKTLTNAAETITPARTEERPKFASREEEKLWLARKHLGKR